jgi:adenylate kinase
MKKLGFDLILLGDPASGKDTQAAIIMKKYALKPVESGKHWRSMLKQKTREGDWLRRTMGVGHPTPVVLMKKFLVENIKKAPKNKNLIFIGNPRLKPEAQLLKKLLESGKRDFFAVYIKVPEAEVFKRLAGRKQTQRRGDDANVSFIQNRINYTKKQVSKTVKYLTGLKKLKVINGKQPIAKVNKDLQKVINDYQRSQKNRPA